MITLASELPVILGNSTVINGSGAPHLTISVDDRFRVFFVGDTTHTVSATIENLTIRHALAKGWQWRQRRRRRWRRGGARRRDLRDQPCIFCGQRAWRPPTMLPVAAMGAAPCPMRGSAAAAEDAMAA